MLCCVAEGGADRADGRMGGWVWVGGTVRTLDWGGGEGRGGDGRMFASVLDPTFLSFFSLGALVGARGGEGKGRRRMAREGGCRRYGSCEVYGWTGLIW